MTEPPDDTIGRTIHVLQAVRRFSGRWFSATDIAEQAHLPVNTSARFLKRFVELGLLERDRETKEYRSVRVQRQGEAL